MISDSRNRKCWTLSCGRQCFLAALASSTAHYTPHAVVLVRWSLFMTRTRTNSTSTLYKSVPNWTCGRNKGTCRSKRKKWPNDSFVEMENQGPQHEHHPNTRGIRRGPRGVPARKRQGTNTGWRSRAPTPRNFWILTASTTFRNIIKIVKIHQINVWTKHTP